MNYTYYRRYQQPRRRRRRKSSFSGFFWFVVSLVILVMVLKSCASMVSSSNQEKKDDIILTAERGTGETLSFGTTEWKVSSDLAVLLEGDSVRSQSGSFLMLGFQDDSFVRMDENTTIQFDRVEMNELGNPELHLVLSEGQVWYERESSNDLSVVVHTDVMEIGGVGEFLINNRSNGEAIYVFDGSASVDYVDPGMDDVVIESHTVSTNTKSFISNETERALIARETVSLSELMTEGELSGIEFIDHSRGVVSIPELEEPEVIEEDPVVEVVEPEEEVSVVEESEEEEVVMSEPLRIEITSPVSGSSDDDGAIAIEGRISSGRAEKVYVTWSGSGDPYPLGLFEPGGSDFRYVADVDYFNFASGENTYTVVAYDKDGNVSNSVSIVINGAF